MEELGWCALFKPVLQHCGPAVSAVWGFRGWFVNVLGLQYSEDCCLEGCPGLACKCNPESPRTPEFRTILATGFSLFTGVFSPKPRCLGPAPRRPGWVVGDEVSGLGLGVRSPKHKA